MGILGIMSKYPVPSDVGRLWPDPRPADVGRLSGLDDADLLSAYAMPDAPCLRVNFVASADGAVTVDGRSGALGGAADKRIFDLLRVPCDAVMVGAGTLRAEGYGPMVVDEAHRVLRRRAGRAEQPVLVVVSGALDVDPDHPMFRDAPVPPWVVTHGGSPAQRRAALGDVATVLVSGESVVDIRAALASLAEAGLRHVLCEGGPHLFGALAAANAVDEFCLTIAPKLAGAGAGRVIAGPLAALRAVDLVQVLASPVGELFLHYRRCPQ